MTMVMQPVMWNNYESMVLPEKINSSVSVHPAGKGTLQCFCRGEVVEMSRNYGWLMVHGHVAHALAGQRGGHIYVCKQDVVDDRLLTKGDLVSFYLYVDGQGLGAEVCTLVQRAAGHSPTGPFQEAQHDNWHGKSSWGNSSWIKSQAQAQPQPHTSWFVPVAFPVSSVPCALPAYLNAAHESDAGKMCITDESKMGRIAGEGELPSIGSVGHNEGTCKRCAFFPKGRCQNGADCTHCHFDHAARERLRKRRQPRSRMQDEDAHGELPLEGANVSETNLKAASMQAECLLQALGSQDDATEAPSTPSLSAVSDDETSPPTPEKLPVAGPACDSSDSEGGTTQAFPTLFHLDEDQGKSESASSEPVTPRQCDQLASSPEASPMSWTAQQRLRKASMSGARAEVSAADVARMARGILNKLTQERFESLCGQILALPLHTPEQLAALAAEIFENVTTQDGFRPLYTELCMRLDAHLAEQTGAVGGKTFRKALAHECQVTFERSLQPVDAALFEGLSEEECFEAEMKLKTRRLGNMRFIGELLVRRLLASKLMPPIILELLHGDEAGLESLIALLAVVAPVFQQQASISQACVRDAFATLRRKRADAGLSTRLRCHLSDLFDAQARGWSARPA